MARFERQTDMKLKALHTDGGLEFNKAREKFKELELVVSITTPYTPASNGLVKRTHGVLRSHARACLRESSIPLRYWNDALRHASFARNAVPHSQTGEAPYTLLYNKSPAYIKHMRPFGCRALVASNSPPSPKFPSKLVEGVHLGHKKGDVYKIWTPNEITLTKHVKMDETSFPGLPHAQQEKDGTIHSLSDGGFGYIDDSDDESTSTVLDRDVVTYIPPLDTELFNHEPPRYNLRSRTAFAMPRYISTCDEPSIREAMISDEADHWKIAMEEEFEGIQKSGVFTTAPHPPVHALPSGVILRLKKDSSGKPSKFKARLVARGNLQRVGDTSYSERYAPVACFDLVRALVAIVVEKQWATRHLDIKGAFLYADLPSHANIWLKLPTIEGISGANGQVVTLVKGLYGLRESPKLWYKTLSDCLNKIGFRQSISNECIFILNKNGKKAILLAYVDDLGLFGDKHVIMPVKNNLENHFEVTALGFIEHFLGVKFSHSSRGTILYQRPLIERLLKDTRMENANEAKTPLPESHILYSSRVQPNAQEVAEMESVPYRETLGALLFLSTKTRPDLSTTTSMLGKHAASPGPTHWRAMKHVLRYLKGTASYGIFFAAGCGLQLEGWSDADWARDQDKRRSRSDMLLTVGGNAVQRISKLQPSVALSTTESEFYALSECIRNVKWMRQLLTELEILPQGPTSIYPDNLGTISWTDEVQGLRNVKHIGIRYSYVGEAVQRKEICVLYVSSVKNKADSFTKALTGKLFNDHRSLLRVASADHPSGQIALEQYRGN